MADTTTITTYGPDGKQISVQAVPESPIAAAAAGMAEMHANMGAWRQQIQADCAAVQTGWQALPPDQQTAIMLRVLNGFTSIMAVLLDHATVTGAITPS